VKRRCVPIFLGLSLIAGLAAGANVFYGVAGQSPALSSLYTIDSATGATTLVGSTGFTGVGAIAVSAGGVLYGIAGNRSGTGVNHQLITINTSTGAGTLVGLTGVTGNFTDIAFRSDGVLFAMTRPAGVATLYTINTSTGVATLINAGTSLTSGGGLAFNPTDTLYLASGSNLQTVNPSNGAQTNAATLAFVSGTNTLPAMKFDPSGVLYALAWALDSSPPSQLVTVNTATGAMVSLGSNGVRLEGLAITSGTTGPPPPPPPPTTPIPSTLLLMGTGVLALAAWQYWRRRMAA